MSPPCNLFYVLILCCMATQIATQIATQFVATENVGHEPVNSVVAAPAENIVSAIRDGKKNVMMTTRLPTGPESSPIQILDTTRINFQEKCEQHNGLDRRGLDWRFSYQKAECDKILGDRRLIRITCNARYRDHTDTSHESDDRIVMDMCLDNKVCQHVFLIGKADEGPDEEIACVDEDAVKTEEVSPSGRTSRPGQQNVHCGLSLSIPGPRYRQRPGVNVLDVVLTEEVLFPNGSVYPAPRLFIRDKSNRYGFDRVYRRDASVASARIELESVRGKLQSKTFEFCMQMLPSVSAASVIFTYSWFQVPHRRNGVTKFLELKKTSLKDVKGIAPS